MGKILKLLKPALFEGAATAIVTPFGADGNIDFTEFGKLIEAQISGGISALIVCGTTGEASTLSDDEHIAAIEFTVKQVNKRIPVIAGTGSNDTLYALELSKKAESAGVDGLLLVTPYYNKTSQKGLLAHFGTVADNVKIPIILYNIKGRTNMNIDIPTMQELSRRHANIVAVKECGEIDYFARVADETDLVIYSGDDGKTVPAMTFGAKGVISVASNIIPKQISDMVGFALKGDFLSAGQLQLKYNKFNRALFADVNPILIKALMNVEYQVKPGNTRLPLVPPEDNVLAALIKEYRALSV